MKVLVIGGGGREDALVWKISQSDLVREILCAPGNAGIALRPKTTCVPIKANDINALLGIATREGIDLTVVGPEEPLVKGRIVARFQEKGLKICGPQPLSADLEGSKVRAKRFMEKHNIPTAAFMVFGDTPWSSNGGVEEAKKFAKANLPCVVKANGLAAGKGAIPCFRKEEAYAAIERMLVKKDFDDAGRSIIIEEFLKGEEATFKVLTDGREAIPLLATQDHKPIYDNDQGPNTGGMGAYAPAPVITKELEKEIMETIIIPTINKTREEGWSYQGILYVGLMITLSGPKVLEFNVRFGDPELQPLVLLMESDIVPFLEGIAEGRLPEKKIKWTEGAAVCVVMASKGYPGTPETGKEIHGLEEVARMKDVVVFHAGIARENGIWKTAGGRVLGVTARAEGIPEAIDLAYKAVSKISWEGEYHRTDIGKKALKRGVQVKMGL